MGLLPSPVFALIQSSSLPLRSQTNEDGSSFLHPYESLSFDIRYSLFDIRYSLFQSFSFD
jgi:hypothetical protein